MDDGIDLIGGREKSSRRWWAAGAERCVDEIVLAIVAPPVEQRSWEDGRRVRYRVRHYHFDCSSSSAHRIDSDTVVVEGNESKMRLSGGKLTFGSIDQYIPFPGSCPSLGIFTNALLSERL